MRPTLAVLFVLCAAAFAQEPRPYVPSAETLAAPTSQIAAWYRYAVGLEESIAVLQKERDAAVAVAEAMTGAKALRERLAALESQSVPRQEYEAVVSRLLATQQQNIYLAGQLNKTATNPTP